MCFPCRCLSLPSDDEADIACIRRSDATHTPRTNFLKILRIVHSYTCPRRNAPGDGFGPRGDKVCVKIHKRIISYPSKQSICAGTQRPSCYVSCCVSCTSKLLFLLIFKFGRRVEIRIMALRARQQSSRQSHQSGQSSRGSLRLGGNIQSQTPLLLMTPEAPRHPDAYPHSYSVRMAVSNSVWHDRARKIDYIASEVHAHV